MATKAPAIVRGDGGLLGAIIDRDSPPSEASEATVEILLDDGRMLLVPSDVLVLQADGSYRLGLSIEEAKRFTRESEGETAVIPVMAETAQVRKRKVETGRVRVRKTVKTTEKVVDEPVTHEEVEVERVPINRMIDEAIGPRQEGDTLIVPLLEEVLVVEKRIMLREEIRIKRRKVERRSSETVTLRSEEATVERVGNGEQEGGPEI